MIDVVPRGVCTHHRVEDGEELAHARGQRDFLRFVGGKEATIERAEHRVAARADKGRHEQRRAHGRATHGPTPRPWTRGSPAEFLGQALPDKYACVVWHVLASEIHRAAAASDWTLCQITASDDFVRQRKGLERAFECLGRAAVFQRSSRTPGILIY